MLEQTHSQEERGSRMTAVPEKEPALTVPLCFPDRCRHHGYNLSTTLLPLRGATALSGYYLHEDPVFPLSVSLPYSYLRQQEKNCSGREIPVPS
ncbi:unnamed protein product [Rangifer tarandus platyrhynchus]|uniref:Uncharacterized protein n=1 Tax=Rangifer tarandus platyrhynchus TaxID=3082113 RepID=A0ABN9A238_RANTA|nr:unnamed protein product [Rangifer tarandus platyrhynchus]